MLKEPPPTHTHTMAATAAPPHLPTTAAATGDCNKSLTTRLFVQRRQEGEHERLVQGGNAEPTQTAEKRECHFELWVVEAGTFRAEKKKPFRLQTGALFHQYLT